MAYQLIYTSAPRALEAGRSGFGTVARHREISSQLVAVLERVSQFSRLPGSNIHRVIFSHRIITLAGVRYHVLSSIRDAGADYTGRTNHIAHHLVVSSREVAQLGASCPSPAEILTSMPWATSWLEAPRFLGSDEEVFLAAFPPGQSAGAWASLTGNPNHAWILMTGEAARGAYLVHPAHADLLRLFDESLQLSPDRLWQIAFTTSLQPSDEVSDFRWIGIESDSPLRNQAEGAGRIAFNLSAPTSLPQVESSPAIPSSATSTPVPIQPSPNTPDGINLIPERHGTPPLSFPQQSVPRTPPPPTTNQASGGVAQKTAHTSGKLNPLWPALVALLFVGLGIFQFQKIKTREFEHEITAALTPLNEDYPEILKDLKEQAALKGTSSRADVKELALLIGQLPQNCLRQSLNISEELEKIELFQKSKNGIINIPRQANEIKNSLKELSHITEELIQKQTTEPPKDRLKKLGDISLKIKEKEKEKLFERTPFKQIIHSIITSKNEAFESELLVLINNSKNNLEPADFRILLPEPSSGAARQSGKSGETNNTLNILNAWEKLEEFKKHKTPDIFEYLKKSSSNSNPLPAWLREEINKQLAPVPAAAPPTTLPPVSAVVSSPIPDSRKPIEYYLNTSDWKKDKTLIIPEFSKSGSLTFILETGSLNSGKKEGPGFKKVFTYQPTASGFISFDLQESQIKPLIEERKDSNDWAIGTAIEVSDDSTSRLEYKKNGTEEVFCVLRIGKKIETEKAEKVFEIVDGAPKIRLEIIKLHHGHSLDFRPKAIHRKPHSNETGDRAYLHLENLEEKKRVLEQQKQRIKTLASDIHERLAKLTASEHTDLNSDVLNSKNEKAFSALSFFTDKSSRIDSLQDFSKIIALAGDVDAFLKVTFNFSQKILNNGRPPTLDYFKAWGPLCRELKRIQDEVSGLQSKIERAPEKSKDLDTPNNNKMIPGTYTVFASSRFVGEFKSIDLYRVVVQEPTASPVAPPSKP
jgi:hypothetical protein